jgi:hypothetical protein
VVIYPIDVRSHIFTISISLQNSVYTNFGKKVSHKTAAWKTEGMGLGELYCEDGDWVQWEVMVLVVPKLTRTLDAGKLHKPRNYTGN